MRGAFNNLIRMKNGIIGRVSENTDSHHSGIEYKCSTYTTGTKCTGVDIPSSEMNLLGEINLATGEASCSSTPPILIIEENSNSGWDSEVQEPIYKSYISSLHKPPSLSHTPSRGMPRLLDTPPRRSEDNFPSLVWGGLEQLSQILEDLSTRERRWKLSTGMHSLWNMFEHGNLMIYNTWIKVYCSRPFLAWRHISKLKKDQMRRVDHWAMLRSKIRMNKLMEIAILGLRHNIVEEKDLAQTHKLNLGFRVFRIRVKQFIKNRYI